MMPRLVFGPTEWVAPGVRALPLRCQCCGVRVDVLAPMDVRTMGALIQAFEETHAECVLSESSRGEARSASRGTREEVR